MIQAKSFHQSENWQKFQSSIGNYAIFIENILVIFKKLPFNKTFAEIPRGELNPDNWQKIKEECAKQQAIFVRIAPNDEKIPDFLQKQAKKVPNHRFPELTLILDLNKSEEELKAEMNQAGRRHLKKAQQSEIKITESKNVDLFMNIFAETTKRDGFSGHNKNYYQKILDIFGKNAFMFIAEHEQDVLSAGIFAYTDDVCIYLYGASSNNKRELQAPTLLQWQAILKAKQAGKKYYDFFGIAPENAKNHPWQGVSQFKRKFGGTELAYAPEFEIPLSKFWYFLFNFTKKIKNIF